MPSVQEFECCFCKEAANIGQNMLLYGILSNVKIIPLTSYSSEVQVIQIKRLEEVSHRTIELYLKGWQLNGGFTNTPP